MKENHETLQFENKHIGDMPLKVMKKNAHTWKICIS